MAIQLTPELEIYVQNLLKISISKERIGVLQTLIDYIKNKISEDQTAHLNFICTHNSRRSQFSQIWAFTAAAFYDVPVKCFSGGVEVTSFNKRAVASIVRNGFLVSSQGKENPIYQIRYNNESLPITVFSKKFDASENRCSSFAAIMTCTHAEENCPFIPGAEARISLTYEDPKAFDNTELEKEKYDERSLQIASELFYVFKQVIS